MSRRDTKEGQYQKPGDKRGAAAAEGGVAEDLDQPRNCGNWEKEAILKSMKSIKSAGPGNLLDWVDGEASHQDGYPDLGN